MIGAFIHTGIGVIVCSFYRGAVEPMACQDKVNLIGSVGGGVNAVISIGLNVVGNLEKVAEIEVSGFGGGVTV